MHWIIPLQFCRFDRVVSQELQFHLLDYLYQNILDREPDKDGYDYWVRQLNNGIEERSELLLGFAESTENQTLFSEVTGLY